MIKSLAFVTVLGVSSISALGLAVPAMAAALPDCTKSGSCCPSKAVPASASASSSILETAIAAGQFKTLATALETAGLLEALSGKGPFTVFAPTDAAFALLPEGTIASLLEPKNRALLTSILTYHVVPGNVSAEMVVKLDSAGTLNGQRASIEVSEAGVQVAGVTVVTTDIECSNGVIHVIDAVMMPSTKNIVETAVAAGSFKTLVAAVQAAGLAEALSGKGPFTVFAPSDEAFAALPAGTLEMLLKPENKDKLASILKYHVVPGRVYSDQLETGKVATLLGSEVSVRIDEHGAFLNDAKVTMADIETTNGVIHVIDKVLLPQ